MYILVALCLVVCTCKNGSRDVVNNSDALDEITNSDANVLDPSSNCDVGTESDSIPSDDLIELLVFLLCRGMV